MSPRRRGFIRGDEVASGRRAVVAQRYLQRETYAQIAAAVGVSSVTVWKDVQRIRAGWKESAEQAIGERIAQEMATLDEIERRAWLAWEASKSDIRVTYAETNDGSSKAGQRTTTTPGDPRWAGIILDCVERRCKLLGIDAPEKHQVSIVPVVREYPSAWATLPAIEAPHTNGNGSHA